jgi:hypothetical protein
LDRTTLDHVCQHHALENAKHVNHYIRCFRLGLTIDEIAAIENAAQRQYLLQHHKAGTILAIWTGMVPEGRIGWVPSAMAQLLRVF